MRAIVYVFFLVVFYSCSKKDVSHVEDHNYSFVMPELKSTLNIHFKMDKASINDTFNILIDNYLQADMELEALGSDVKLSKTEDATMEFRGRTVHTKLPVTIEMTKETFIKDIQADGSIELSFVSHVDIDSNWTVITKTELENYEWIEKPRLNLGGLKINISSLANTIIDRSKEEFERQIDLSVSEQLDFRNRMLGLMKNIENPILIDTLLNSWLYLRPQKVYMSHVENTEDYAIGNLTIHGVSKLSSKKPSDVIPGLKLPEFSWEEKLDDTSHVNMVLDVSYDKINQYLKENYVNETLGSGNKQITIKDIDLTKDGDKLRITSDVAGTLNGKLIVSGKPIFDNTEQLFYVDDVDIQVQTKNVLKKTAAWLLKGKIKNQLKDMLRFSMNDNLMELQNVIDQQIEQYKIEDQLDFRVDIKKLHIDKFVLDSDRIHAFVTLNVYIETIVYDLTAFDSPTLFKLRD